MLGEADLHQGAAGMVFGEAGPEPWEMEEGERNGRGRRRGTARGSTGVPCWIRLLRIKPSAGTGGGGRGAR